MVFVVSFEHFMTFRRTVEDSCSNLLHRFRNDRDCWLWLLATSVGLHDPNTNDMDNLALSSFSTNNSTAILDFWPALWDSAKVVTVSPGWQHNLWVTRWPHMSAIWAPTVLVGALRGRCRFFVRVIASLGIHFHTFETARCMSRLRGGPRSGSSFKADFTVCCATLAGQIAGRLFRWLLFGKLRHLWWLKAPLPTQSASTATSTFSVCLETFHVYFIILQPSAFSRYSNCSSWAQFSYRIKLQRL